MLENNSISYLFYAQRADGANMNIVLENTGALGILLTADSYIDIAMSNLGDTMSASGISDVVTEKATVQFLGEEYPCINITGTIAGMTMYETVIPMVFRNRVACITIASFNTDARAEILATFAPLSV
jgi:hypothetical protein